ncbi:sugar ABC transporter ATP-binding protein [Autumnicola psychrophila]|uniref:Sugar ABC transporter ATP-binding protein n=1 Tax=Autumnicola psychrophila TaxID=3075592 RepID=A0ABU3DU29_9FLAO|nr:sugar ABC transporter ATP-binding protein [Zunongwangia sp. F225]MDT0687231.1 sugar ABC transporter ATP-binding protein [Zunongwangia sp. F225]
MKVNEPILRVENITKEFPGVKALNEISLQLEGGVATAIIGENGAGKSTLMKILSGVYNIYEGEIYYKNELVHFQNTTEAQQKGVAIIHQELNLIPNLTISENVFLGREPLTSLGIIDYPLMRKNTAKLLERMKLQVDPDTPIFKLKVGEQQLVEITKALSLNPEVIIMDEPTSAISENEVEVLFEIIKDLKAEGKAIVYISHKLDELFKITEKYVVLRDGKFIESGEINATTEDELIHKMVGREIIISRESFQCNKKECLLSVKNLSLKNLLVRDNYLLKEVNFELFKGEVLGLFGLMGAGRTELMEVLFGLYSSRISGEVYIKGQLHQIKSPRDAMDKGLALVPENRKEDGLVLGFNITKNTSLTVLDQVSSAGFLRKKKDNDLATKYMESLKIKASSPNQIVEKLSGGNQQKVVLAKWFATHPEILMLDEPTRGIDINAKNEIYKLVRKQSQNGLGVIFVSSELPEILAVCDRVLVMAEGRITANIEVTKETSENQILKAAIPKIIKNDNA